MALVEIYHVVASVKPVATGQTIKEGQIVSLNSSAQIVLQGYGSANYVPFGIAGDTKMTTQSYMPGVASGWQSRASDYYDETKASAKMTVYHSGGEFATDMYATNVASATPYTALYAVNGLLETANTQSSGVVAYLTKAAGAYPSGVPGTDVNGDQALSSDSYTNSGVSNQYIEIKLVI